jgi:dihydropteroate synthase
MGILNVTPDSFSDGGRFLAPQDAVDHGLALTEEGADLVDVGGESTRPGALRIPLEVEQARVLPVVSGLAAAGVHVSIDTMSAVTARAAVDAGAVLVNDVSGGQADPQMLATMAKLDVPYVVMHWRGPSAEMERLADYDDVVSDVVGELRDRVDAALDAGLSPSRLVLDPGLGFAKKSPHNWALLARLDALAGLGRPLLIGASRKRFLSGLGTGCGPEDVAESRDAATDAVSALAARDGVWGVRVHDPRGSRAAVAVAAEWNNQPGHAGKMGSDEY